MLSSCLTLPSAGLIGVCHHLWLNLFHLPRTPGWSELTGSSLIGKAQDVARFLGTNREAVTAHVHYRGHPCGLLSTIPSLSKNCVCCRLSEQPGLVGPPPSPVFPCFPQPRIMVVPQNTALQTPRPSPVNYLHGPLLVYLFSRDLIGQGN